MICKINTNEAAAVSIVEVTPDDLIVIARRMHLEASKALPGEEVLVPITEKITLKYNPEITTSTFSGRANVSSALPGTAVSNMVESRIKEITLTEELTTLGANP